MTALSKRVSVLHLLFENASSDIASSDIYRSVVLLCDSVTLTLEVYEVVLIRNYANNYCVMLLCNSNTLTIEVQEVVHNKNERIV